MLLPVCATKRTVANKNVELIIKHVSDKKKEFGNIFYSFSGVFLFLSNMFGQLFSHI